MRSPTVDAPLGVDLSLAVNYLPGCVCLLKSALLSAWLCALEAYAVHPGLFGTALLLLFDRLAAPPRIFDANGVLLGIFAAHAAHELQRHCAHAWGLPPLLAHALYWEWGAFTVWSIWTDLARGNHPRPHRSHAALQLVGAHMALVAFFEAPAEPLLLRASRYLTYAVLCVGWVYAVALARGRLAHTGGDCGARFTLYFAPALYAPPAVCTVHSALIVLLCLSTLAPPPPASPGKDVEAPPALQDHHHHHLHHHNHSHALPPPPPPPTLSSQPPLPPQAVLPGLTNCCSPAQEPRESLEELEHMFRMAQLARPKQ